MRIRYARFRWTVACRGDQVFLRPGATPEEQVRAAARLQEFAAACFLRVVHKHLWTELGRLGDMSWGISVEHINGTAATLLVDVWYGARDWSQVGLRLFWFPTRGWPSFRRIIKDVVSEFMGGLGAVCETCKTTI